MARQCERAREPLTTRYCVTLHDSGSGGCPAEGDAGSCPLPGVAACSAADLAPARDLPGCRVVPTGCGAQSAEPHDAVGGLEHLAVADAVLDLKLDEVLGLDAV